MKAKLHAIAGGIALATVSMFWVTTIWSEVFGGPGDIAAAKTAILWGMLILVPAMMAVGASGSFLGRGWSHPAVERKAKRMRVIAANGILILVPAAFFLAMKANAGAFDTLFYGVQALELAAGAVNIALIGRNMRDGLSIRRRRAAAE